MAIAFKSRSLTGGQNSSGQSNAAAQTVAAGDTLVAILHMDCRGSGTLVTGTVTDSQGNTWTRIGASESSVASHQQRTEVWIATNTSFSGSLSFTVALSGTAQAWTIQIQNYTGVVQKPTSVKFSTNYTGSSVSAAINQANVNTTDMIVAFYTSNNTIPGGGPSGFTFADATTSGLSEVAQAYKLESSVVTETGNFGNASYAAYGTLVLYSAAVIVPSNKFDGSALNTGNGSATSSISYDAAAGDIVVIGVGAHSHTNQCRVSTITDSAGLTWHRRRQSTTQTPYTSNSSDRITCEYWWAFAASRVVGGTITVTFDTTSNLDYSQAFWASFAGVGNTSKPWASAAAGFVQTFGNSGSTQLMTPSVTSSATGDMLIGFFASLTKTPGSVPAINGTPPMGAGVTSTGTAQGVGGTYNRAPSASTFQWNWNNAQNGYTSFGDALGITGGGAGDASDLTSGPTLDAAVSVAPGNTMPATFTYSANANRLIVLQITSEGDGGYIPVTAVSDGTLTFQRRSRKQVRSLAVGSGQAEYVTMEIWWAYTTVAVSSRTMTVTYDTSASSGHRNVLGTISTYDNIQNTSAPWDNNASAHNDFSYANASTKQASPSFNITTSQTNDLVLGWSYEGESSGSGILSTAGSGFTLNASGNVVRGSTPNRVWLNSERKAVTASGTQSVAFTDATGKLLWIVIGDALSGTMTGSNTDTSVTNITSTITTSLTKASQSLAGTEKMTGTIVSSFSRFSQSLSGVMGSVTGTATSNFGRFAQQASGYTNVFGDIVSTFGRFGQTVTAFEIISGSIDTALHGINEAGTGVMSGEEIFSGTITSSFSGISQALTGTETISGDITTRFGNVSGQMVGNAAQGLVIIQGPAVSNFGGFSQVLSGRSQLDTSSTFYSWYNTDG
jgi:hypothetical protein